MFTWIYKHQKLILTLLIAAFIISLIPICLIAGYDCAAGDDYMYGGAAHLAFLKTGSVFAALLAAAQYTVEIWYTWQGTWFDVFVFCLHPEVFSEGAYVIVPYIFMIMQVLAFGFFARHFLKVRWKFQGLYWIIVSVVFLLFSFQLVPSQKCAFYWWVGCVHYCLPMAMTLVGIVCIDRFIYSHKGVDLFFIILICTLLGGATYPAAMLIILAGILLILEKYVIGKRKDKADLLLVIPFALEMIGLVISMIAPGNAIRSEHDIMEEGAVPSGGVVATIVKSIIFSVQEAGSLFLGSKSFTIIALVLVLVLTLAFFLNSESKAENKERFSHPLLFFVSLFLLNASMYTPRLYAGGYVSSGYLNFNYWMFFMCAIAVVVYICGWIVCTLGIDHIKVRISAVLQWCVVALICLVVAFLGRHGIKEYTDYKCLDYYRSGQADDYMAQMKLQRYLMSEEGVDDVVVPEINNEQGPLMHMPIVADPENIDNTMTQAFYGKNSCRSVPRPQWMEEYGERYADVLRKIGLK